VQVDADLILPGRGQLHLLDLEGLTELDEAGGADRVRAGCH
jgi:hypothetical protein